MSERSILKFPSKERWIHIKKSEVITADDARSIFKLMDDLPEDANNMLKLCISSDGAIVKLMHWMHVGKEKAPYARLVVTADAASTIILTGGIDIYHAIPAAGYIMTLKELLKGIPEEHDDPMRPMFTYLGTSEELEIARGV